MTIAKVKRKLECKKREEHFRIVTKEALCFIVFHEICREVSCDKTNDQYNNDALVYELTTCLHLEKLIKMSSLD